MKLGEGAAWVLPSASVPGCLSVNPVICTIWPGCLGNPFQTTLYSLRKFSSGPMQCWTLGEVMSAALGLCGSLWGGSVPQLFQEPYVCIPGFGF